MHNLRHIHQINPRTPTNTAFTTIAGAQTWARQQFGEISDMFPDGSGFVAFHDITAHVFWLDSVAGVVRYLSMHYVNA